MNLTPRQTQILKAIVEEYIDTATAVGSEVLDKKYNLGVSPATIRNEMALLTSGGFLKQPHTSAGRIPTSTALKFYVEHLMQEKKLSVGETVRAKESVWDVRDNADLLMREAALVLAEHTGNLSIISTDDGSMYYAGTANLLDKTEFFDIDVMRHVLALLDQRAKLRGLFYDSREFDNSVHVVFGADLNWPFFDTVGMAFCHFPMNRGHVGTLGVIGPCRMDFPYVVPVVRHFSQLMGEFANNW